MTELNGNKNILLTSDKIFRQIFQSSAEGILMVDEQGLIQMANPVAEKMFGYETGELHEKIIEELLPVELRVRHVKYREAFNERPEPRPMGHGRDLLGKRKNGEEFPVAVSLSYLKTEAGLLVTAFITDITERKKVEKTLKQTEE